MRRVGFISFVILIVIIAGFIFVKKSYYPPLPIGNLTTKEAIERLEETESKIVEIAVEEDTIWYITKTENKGISIADENIKHLIGAKGWDFKEKDGAGLFFEKGEERLVVTTEMWGKHYVIVKVQSKFKEL
ncbi:hypothetical protein GCM10008967_38460 [Bacillus carboniphilus]|uniref:Uncharacterized protein n=1 Tax=Bacillus carboniphilus TaxID=86663 RepID=A0ABP3GIM3_9BACI